MSVFFSFRCWLRGLRTRPSVRAVSIKQRSALSMRGYHPRMETLEERLPTNAFLSVPGWSPEDMLIAPQSSHACSTTTDSGSWSSHRQTSTLQDLMVAPQLSAVVHSNSTGASGSAPTSSGVKTTSSGPGATAINGLFSMPDAGSLFNDPISGQSSAPARPTPVATSTKAGNSSAPAPAAVATPASGGAAVTSAAAPAPPSGGTQQTTQTSAPVAMRPSIASTSSTSFAPAATTLSSQATTAYYVSTTGSDSNPGTQAQPFRTIHHGVSVLQPGSTLYIMGGTYSEALQNSIPGGTSWSAPVTVAAYPGQSVTIQPPSGSSFGFLFSSAASKYIVLSGLTIDARNVANNAIKITWSTGGGPATNISVQNCVIENAPYSGILVAGQTGEWSNGNQFINDVIHDNGKTYLDHGIYITTNNNLVQGCTFYNNAGEGVQIYSSDAGASQGCSNNVVDDNKFYHNSTTSNWDPGLGIYTGTGNLAYNNLIWNNPVGIAVDFGATNTYLFNNTIYNNFYDSGIAIGENTTATNTYIYNNILYQNATAVVNNGSNTVQSNDLTANPLFVNAAAADFHLQAGSPAINSGMTLSQVPTDFDGVARPAGAYTIGAYQAGTQTQPTVDLSWSAGGISGPASLSAGSSFTLSRSFTISNAAAPGNFTIAYYASPDNVFGNNNDILLGTETMSGAGLTMGAHSGTSPTLQIGSAGTYYLFAKLNSGSAFAESNSGNNTTMAPQPVTVSGGATAGTAIVVDNGGPGYSQTGSEWHNYGSGYGGSSRYHAAGSGAEKATWQVSGLAAGTYTVQVTWPADSNRATNAPFSIYDGSTLLATVAVNERVAPTGTTVNGRVFQTLGTYQVSSGNLRVVLSDNANKFVFADAVRIVPS